MKNRSYVDGLLSIIVSAYNCEKSIEKCINSILKQTYNDIEIIIINDGSTDRTDAICREMAKQENRIRYIFKENGGVSSARNRGLNIANGEFIQFVDSDDYLEKQMSKVLIDSINKNSADIVVCGYKRINKKNIEDKRGYNKIYENVLSMKEDFSGIFDSHLFNSPVNKIYRKNKINLGFPVGISLGEDLIFNLNYFSSCEKIVFIPDCLYNYVISEGDSLNLGYRDDIFNNTAYVYSEMKNFCLKCFKDEKSLEIADKEFITMMYYLLKKLILVSPFTKEEKFLYIKKYVRSDYVKNINKGIKLSDKQVRLVWILIKKEAIKMIYIFLRAKNF